MATEQVQHPRLDTQAEEQAHNLGSRFPGLALVERAEGEAGQAFGRLHPLPHEGVDEIWRAGHFPRREQFRGRKPNFFPLVPGCSTSFSSWVA